MNLISILKLEVLHRILALHFFTSNFNFTVPIETVISLGGQSRKIELNSGNFKSLVFSSIPPLFLKL